MLRRINWPLAGMAALFLVVFLMPPLQALQGVDVMPLWAHVAGETFSIVIAMMMFGIVWNAYGVDRPGNTLIIACGFLAVGLLDFGHMLSFKGMPDFVTPSGPEKAIQFWLAMRFVVALTLLAVALRSWQPLSNPRIRYGLLTGSLAITAFIFWLVLALGQELPHTFIEGEGLTPLKVGAEYFIIAMFMASAVLFYRQAQRPPGPFRSFDSANLFAASVISMLSELSLVLYSAVGDIFNLLGHVYEIVSYVFIYRAVFVDSVREPYSKLQQAKESLASSRQMLRSIIDNVPARIFWKDHESRYLGANNLFLRDAGVSDESQLIGKNDFELFPEQAELFRADDRRVMETGTPKLDYEEPIKTAEGRTGYLLTSKVLLRGTDGKVSGVLGTYVDITEQKRMAKLLQASELEFRALAENSPNIILRYDWDCRLIYANSAYERETQVPADEAMYLTPDRHWRATMPVGEYKRKLVQVMETGVPCEILLEWKRLDNGHSTSYAFQVVAERSMDGKVEGVLAIGHNVTALMAAEQRLEESYAQLRELTTRREEAREDERKRIARDIHDELGQMLTALRMEVSLLRMTFGQDNPQLMGQVQNIMGHVDATIQVVRNVAAKLRPAVLDMGIVSAMEWQMGEFAKRSGIRCGLNISEEDIYLDEERSTALYRVVQESLTNVARHAQAENVDISLWRDGESYLLEVRDDGKGFDPETLKKKTFGLMGIRERVMLLQGELDITSEPGSGTTVSVRIPVHRA
ncbi:MASE3 domain-containing protein [Ferrigenium kumadai]|nr:MASE3 domain-containing protein [Ferrigenium kumadai]